MSSQYSWQLWCHLEEEGEGLESFHHLEAEQEGPSCGLSLPHQWRPHLHVH